ncbi:MAG: GNAT family N-acetyltransferase [Cyclobacteriaceae bacterium]|nr:GNAT family N-acetyltransferase [Cyclobacteriaceae bacterium]
MDNYLFESERLGFGEWTMDDLDDLAAMNQDPDVMAYFPATHSVAYSREFLLRQQRHFAENGLCFFRVETRDTSRFIGFLGIQAIPFPASFGPGFEIGWRLVRQAWGNGYATEGALRCMTYAHEAAGLGEIYAFTSIHNQRSARVMRKTGMTCMGTFQHPRMEAGHWLETHVLYHKLLGQ